MCIRDSKGTDPSASDFKSAAELSISGSKPYSGTFRLAAADRALTSGDYTIHVRATDKAGNQKVKSCLLYTSYRLSLCFPEHAR